MEARRLRKRLLTVFMSVVFVLVGLFAVACSDENRGITDGDEIGVYYNDDNGSEYLITLSTGGKFTFAFDADEKAGVYAVLDGTITFVYGDKSGSLTGTLNGDTITVQYDGRNVQFLKKIDYTVTFASESETYRTETVLNGKTLAKPADPEREGFTFLGWYSDEAYKNAFLFDAQPVRGDISLYARWFEGVAGDSEFTIDFAGAGEYGSMTTIAGKLPSIPVPEKSGDTFLGWWVSLYDDAERLSYRYTEDMEFAQNTTLFALWESDGELTVSVAENLIGWDATIGTSYSWKVEDSKGETIKKGTLSGGGSVTEVDFSALPAGDYTITVNDTIRYYKNKALAAVSLFEVVGSTLKFNKVENAAKYFVTIVCGNGDHVHTDLELGASDYYDFSNCDMPKEGITFVVKAKAEGYASSESRTFKFVRALDEVTDISYDGETGLLSWTAVENAEGYLLTVNGKTVDVGNKTEFSLKDYTGEIAIGVQPVAEGFYSESGAYNFTKETLATPCNLKITDTTLTWNKVSGAAKYEIKIGDEVKESSSESVDLEQFTGWVKGNDYILTIRAIGDTNSVWSDGIDLRYYQMHNSLGYKDGEVTWRYVVGASSYEVKVNDGAEQKVVGFNRAEIKFTQTGENTIAVRFTDAKGEKSEWAEVTVTAYEMKFDAQGGTAVSSCYFVAGDYITLPDSTTMTGYDFNAWYSIPNGPLNNGKKFSDGRYTAAEDIMFYAYWTAKNVTVSFASDNLGESVAATTVKYGSDYTLPVPVTKVGKEDYVFNGWYIGEKRYTDKNGESLAAWNTEEEQVFTAQWLKVFSFTYSSYEDAYSVKYASEISKVTEVTVPATYNGKPVNVVSGYAFNRCTTLQVVNIPDSVILIESSTAFYGCTALKEVNIYEAGAKFAEYESRDGVLLYHNELENRFELLYFPTARTGAYEIPEGVTTIPLKAFSGAMISEITIPASVTRIELTAFYNCKNLTKINFTAGGQELTLASKAFQNCTSLKEITLPAHLTAFETTVSDAFYNCTSLAKINVEKGNALYSSKDGLLCSADGTTLLYCPLARTDWTNLIPAGITTIGTYAFSGCVEIQMLEIPYYVTTIESYAFNGCIGIDTVNFTGESTLTSIGDYAFAGCVNLYTITIPVGLSELSPLTFYNCVNLEEVRFSGESEYYDSIDGVVFTKDISSIVFFPNGKTGKYELPFGLTKIPAYMFAGTNISSVIIPATVTEIGKAAFYNCPKLKKVTFAEIDEEDEDADKDAEIVLVAGTNTTATTAGVFANCYALEEVILPHHLKTVSALTFYNCSGLQEIEIPNSVTLISNAAFGYCSHLSSLTFEKGGEDDLVIANASSGSAVATGSAFMLCSALTNIDFPARLTTLGEYTFFTHAAIKTVTFGTDEEEPSRLKTFSKHVFNQAPLSEISIPESVTTIEDQAFYGTTSKAYLSEITFEGESNVTSIGSMAFAYSLITSLDIPASVKTIGTYAFQYSTRLPEVYIPATVTSLGANAFTGCSALRTVEFDENSALTSMPNYIFKGCSALTSVNIPETATSIGTYAFQDCISLSSLVIPEKVTSLGNYAFYGCKLFTSFNIPEKVTTLGTGVFRDCTGLTEIRIPASVTSIGNFAFTGCTNLNTVTMDDGESALSITNGTSTTNGAFVGCTNLTSVILPYRITSIGNYTFYGCKNLTSVTFATCADDSDDETVGEEENEKGGEEVSVAAETLAREIKLTSIGNYAFYGTGLASFTVPANLKTIGTYAFAECFAMEGFGVDESNVSFCVKDGVLYNYAGTTLITYPAAKKDERGNSVTSFVIPQEVTVVTDYAFYKCYELLSVSFANDSVAKTIGTYAFAETAISSMVFPTTVTSIGNYAFDGCVELTSVTLPSTLSGALGAYEAGIGIFFGANAVEEVKVAGTGGAYSAQDGVLFYTSGSAITLVYFPAAKVCTEDGVPVAYRIPDGVTTIGTGSFVNTKGLTALSVADSVTLIDDYAFTKNTSIKTVTFGEGSKLATIGGNAFNTAALTAIEFPGSLTSIGAKAFYNCADLESVVFKDGSATKLEISAGASTSATGLGVFSDCASLTSVTLPKRLETISAYMFYRCGLESFTVPNTVKTIGKAAFALNANLETLIFEDAADAKNPDELTITAGTNTTSSPGAFANCTALTSLTLGNRVRTLSNYTFCSCESLTEFTIPETVTSLGTYVFEYAGLTSIEIPGSVQSIGTYAFAYTALESVRIAEGVTSLGTYMFYNCASLASAELPDSITVLPGHLFRNCASLTDFTIAETVYQIDTYAFAGTALVDITIPSSVKTLGANLFDGCALLEAVTLPENVTSIPNYTFRNCSSLRSFTIPETVTTIGTSAFEGCTQLTEVIMYDGVLSLGNSVFLGCAIEDFYLSGTLTTIGLNALDGVLSFGLAPTNTSYLIDSSTGAIYDSDMTVLYRVPTTFSGDFTVPETVTSIAGSAFAYCTELQSIVIPSGVLKILSNTFYGCTALRSVTLHDGITNIDEYAFYGCIALKHIDLPARLSIMAKYAFAYSGIVEIVIPSYVISVNTYLFYHCESLERVVFPESVTSIANNMFEGCISLKSVSLSSRTSTISGYVFKDCTALKEIFIPKSVTTLSAYAFEGWGSDQTIYVVGRKESEKPIGWNANWTTNCEARIVWDVPLTDGEE